MVIRLRVAAVLAVFLALRPLRHPCRPRSSRASSSPTSTAAPTRAPTSSSSPTAPGAPPTRSRPRWPAGAAAGQAGEETKDQLQEILDEAAAAKRERRRGASSSSIGDFYARLHGRGAAQRRSASSPSSRSSPRSTRSKTPPTSAAMIAQLHAIAHPGAVRRRRRLGQPQPERRHRPDLRQRPRDAGPRLLPQDRAALRRGAREVPRPRRRRCSSSPATTRRRRRPPPRPSCAMETQLAEASLDNVALRDPQATDHKTTLRRAPEADAGLRLDAATATRAGVPAGRRQRRRAEVHGGVQTGSSRRRRSPTGRPT